MEEEAKEKEAKESAHAEGVVYGKSGEGYWRDPESGKVMTLSQLLGNLPK